MAVNCLIRNSVNEGTKELTGDGWLNIYSVPLNYPLINDIKIDFILHMLQDNKLNTHTFH